MALTVLPMKAWGDAEVRTTASPMYDVSHDEEFTRLPDVFTPEFRALLEPRIREVEEIVFPLGQKLEVGYHDLNVTMPITIRPTHLESLDSIGNWRADGRLGIDGTLHRLARWRDLSFKSNLVKVRVGRMFCGVAEPLRSVLLKEPSGILLIGRPGTGKTTLLRDMLRILEEQYGGRLFVVDTSLELLGEGPIPHPFLRTAHRVQVGHPERQQEVLDQMIMNGGCQAAAVDEIGYRGDVPLVTFAASRGIRMIGSVHGEQLFDVVKEPRLRPLLGLPMDLDAPVQLGGSHFKIAIEVHRKGHYRVHADINTSVDAILIGQYPPTFDVRHVVSDPSSALVQELDLTS